MQVILFNDFFQQEFTPDEVRSRGLNMFKNSNLITDGSVGYPGTRKSVPSDIRKYIEEKISEPVSLLCEHEKIAVKKNATVQIMYHLTTSIHQQGLIHTDDPSWIAGVIYLNPNPPKNSGTSIHKLKKEYVDTKPGVAGFRTVNTMDDEELIANFGLEKKYYNERYFEEEKNIENIYNSTIMYPGKYWHSPNKYFGETLEDSRFSIVFFANTNYPPQKEN